LVLSGEDVRVGAITKIGLGVSSYDVFEVFLRVNEVQDDQYRLDDDSSQLGIGLLFQRWILGSLVLRVSRQYLLKELHQL
jgi:hypothetical protein